VSNHVLDDVHLLVYLSIVHQEPETDKVGQNSGGAGPGPDGRNGLAWLWPANSEAVRVAVSTDMMLVPADSVGQTIG
jgi:hypothetical protein